LAKSSALISNPRHSVRIAGPVFDPIHIIDVQQLKEVLLQEIVELHPRRLLDNPGQQIDGLVIVLEMGAGLPAQLRSNRQLHGIGSRPGLGPGAGNVFEAGCVVEKLPDRDVPLASLPPFGIKIRYALIE